MIKICDKYFVGFNNRYYGEKPNQEKFLLSYIVKDKGLVSFDTWRDHHIGIKEIDNKPKKGFKVFGNTRRSRDWFGSGRSLLYVQHPEGFVFEISVENLVNILAYCNIYQNEFMQEMIFAHEGSKLILIPVNSALYQEAVTDTKRMVATKTKSLVKPSNLKIGDIIEFTNKSKALYLGKYKSFTWSPSSNQYVRVLKTAKDRHYYLTDYDSHPRLESVQTLKIYQVDSHREISEEKALSTICKFIKYYDAFTPILENSEFSVEKAAWKDHHMGYNVGYMITFDTSINGKSVSYKARSKFDNAFNKTKDTEVIWMTFGKNKICLNISEEQLSSLEKL